MLDAPSSLGGFIRGELFAGLSEAEQREVRVRWAGSTSAFHELAYAFDFRNPGQLIRMRSHHTGMP